MAKEQYWRGVIQEWRSSEHSGADFCRIKGLKYHQLQEWRRIIRDRDDEATVARKVGIANSRRAAISRKVRKSMQSTTHFVPARITDSKRGKSAHEIESKVEVVLSCGTVLRVTPECSVEFLTTLVKALEKLSC